MLLFQKTRPKAGHTIAFASGPDLLAPTRKRMLPASRLSAVAKWGVLFNGQPARGRNEGRDRAVLGDYFDVKRGLATGANDFFILAQKRARELELSAEFLRPILAGQREIPCSVIEADPEGFPLAAPARSDNSPDLAKQTPAVTIASSSGRRWTAIVPPPD